MAGFKNHADDVAKELTRWEDLFRSIKFDDESPLQKVSPKKPLTPSQK